MAFHLWSRFSSLLCRLEASSPALDSTSSLPALFTVSTVALWANTSIWSTFREEKSEMTQTKMYMNPMWIYFQPYGYSVHWLWGVIYTSRERIKWRWRRFVVHDAWRVLSRWLWGLLPLFSVRWAALLCGSSRPAVHPVHAGTGPVPAAPPPICAGLMTDWAIRFGI